MTQYMHARQAPRLQKTVPQIFVCLTCLGVVRIILSSWGSDMIVYAGVAKSQNHGQVHPVPDPRPRLGARVGHLLSIQ